MMNYFKMPTAGKWARVWSQIATRISPNAFYQAFVLTTYLFQIHPALDEDAVTRDGALWSGTLKQLSRESHTPVKALARLLLETELFTATIDGRALGDSDDLPPDAKFELSAPFVEAQIQAVAAKGRRSRSRDEEEDQERRAPKRALPASNANLPAPETAPAPSLDPPSVANDGSFHVDAENFEPAIGVKEPPCQAAIDAWNRFHAGTRAEYRGVASPALSHNLQKTLEEYTLEEIADAFETAKEEPFAWTLTSAAKVDNVQLLLAKREKRALLPPGRNVRTLGPDDYTLENFI